MSKKWKLILGKQYVIFFNNFMVDFDKPWKKKNCCFYELHRSSFQQNLTRTVPTRPCAMEILKFLPQTCTGEGTWRRSVQQVPNSNGGLFVLTTNLAAPEFHPLGGKPHNRGICLSKNHVFRHAKKNMFWLLIPDSSRSVRDTSSKAIWVGHVPPTPYLFNWHRKTQLTPSHPRKNAKTAPPSCKPHVIWSDEGESKWNDITTTSTTLVELDFFFSPLWGTLWFSNGMAGSFWWSWLISRVTVVTVMVSLSKKSKIAGVAQKRRQTFFAVQHSSDCSDFCSLFEVTWCWSSCQPLQGELTTFKNATFVTSHESSWLLHETPSNGLHDCNPPNL